MNTAPNPFANDKDRHEIWEMLVRRDIAAFVASDWSMVADDFIAPGFLGIHAHKSANPDEWTAAFPTLDVYRDRVAATGRRDGGHGVCRAAWRQRFIAPPIST